VATSPSADRWPALPWDDWQDTCDTLHLWTQVVGKVKLKLCPPMNELWQVAFHPTPRGLTTGRIPNRSGAPGSAPGSAFEVSFDFVDHRLSVVTSDGPTRILPLVPQSVAAFHGALLTILQELGIDVAITPRPDEVPDPIPFDQDTVHASYDPVFVRRWWTIMLQTSLVFDRYRSSFAGKSSPVLFWWGSFDLNTTRFSGRPAPPLAGVPRFMRLAEDQENLCTGFWPGNATATGVVVGEPCFYAYSYPEPAGFKDAPIRPGAARYDPRFGEFVLPYEDVRRADDPEGAILDFFESAYEGAARLAHWDQVRPINERG
jgi:hypothetical protein